MEQVAPPVVLDTGAPPATTAAAAGRAILLLHGWTGSKEDFAAVVPALARARRVLAPDLPGHGASPPAQDEDYSIPAHVRFVQQLLDDREVGEVHLVAHSHGGLIAQRLAWAMAHRVASLTLVGSGLGALGEESRQMVARVAVAARERGMAAAWVEVQGPVQGPGQGSDPPTADGEREVFLRDRFLSMTPAAVVGVARNLVTTPPLGAFLRGVDFPVLVCHGDGDTMWLPHEQRLLARRITGASYAVIPDALHSPAHDNPEGLLAVLQPFLDAAERSD